VEIEDERFKTLAFWAWNDEMLRCRILRKRVTKKKKKPLMLKIPHKYAWKNSTYDTYHKVWAKTSHI